MSDLMQLVTSSPIDKTLYDFRDAKAILELRELGFETATKESYNDLVRRQKHARIAAYNYAVITNEAIESYLKRLVEIYDRANNKANNNEENHESGLMDRGMFSSVVRLIHLLGSFNQATDSDIIICTFQEHTCDFCKDTGTGQFVYEEVALKDYPNLPPRDVVEKLKEHKARNLFDYFSIGYVKGVPDPMLFGRINEDKTRRWFIAQWGNDVSLDDLI